MGDVREASQVGSEQGVHRQTIWKVPAFHFVIWESLPWKTQRSSRRWGQI